MRIKPDSEYIQILYPKNYFSKFNKLYGLKNKKVLQMAYYIEIFVCYLDILKKFECNNG